MTDQTSTAPIDEPKSKRNCFLWGCLAAVLLIVVSFCCLGTLIFVPFFTDFDPLGLDMRDRIEQYIPLEDFLEDPSQVPGIPEIIDDTLDPFSGSDSDTDSGEFFSTDPEVDPEMMDLSTYVAEDFPATFDYPSEWEIETEEYGVTIYDLNSYTYLYVGEVLYDDGTTARQIADDVINSLMEDAEEGSFVILEEMPFTVPTGDDAYLVAFEFVDSDGYYQWVLDLETIHGESNVYFYLSGEDPEDYPFYRDLIEVIAASFSR